MAKVTNLVKAEFFEDPELRLIYQKVKYHYDKYGAVPAQSSLRDAINNSTTDLIDKEAVKELVTELWEEVPEPEEFIIDKVTQFVRSNKVRSTLSEYLPRMKDEGEDILTELGEKLSDSVELEVDMEQHLVLSDTKKLPEVRRAAVGAEERSVIIQSSFNSVNRALTFGGYKYGDLAAFIAPPGCFTGDTKLMTLDGITHTFEELYNSGQDVVGVYSSDLSDKCRVKVSQSSEVKLSKYVDELIEVEIDRKYKVKCTPDHPFLLRSGVYRKAEDLSEYDELMPFSRWDNHHGPTEKCKTVGDSYFTDTLIDHYYKNIVEEVGSNSSVDSDLSCHKVSKVSKIKLREKVPVYGLVEVHKYNNYAIALTENDGIIVSNTGKSFSLVNEGVYAVTQGFQVFHAFIGDMSLYDGWIRYVSNITGIYQDQLVKMTPEDQIKVIKDCNTLGYFDKVCIVSYPAESITVNQLIRDIGKYQSKLHTKFDMIIVDYPDNLVAESDMMYLSGGTIYNKLSGLAQRNRSVVLVASQPKISYYDAEIIPLEGAAESSKKQQNLDLMVTLGKPYRDFECLTGFIAKNRRGSTGDIFRVKTEFENARMNEISSLEYQKLLAEYQGGHYNE